MAELTKITKGLISATDTYTFANVVITGNVQAANFLTSNGAPLSTGGGGGSAIVVQDEGSTLTAGVTQINFVGSGVTATNSGSNVTVTIPGSVGGGGGGASSALVAGYAMIFGGF
jgi:hypothetical protein